MSDQPKPDVRQLVGGSFTDADTERRKVQNQVAAERAGHVQPLPMTHEGLALLVAAKDRMVAFMRDRGVDLRDVALASVGAVEAAALRAQGQSTRDVIGDVRSQLGERLAQYQAQALAQQSLRPAG